MSFGGFLDNSSGGGGAKIVADIPYSNNMPTGAIAQPRLVSPSLPKGIFNSPGLSLALVMITTFSLTISLFVLLLLIFSLGLIWVFFCDVCTLQQQPNIDNQGDRTRMGENFEVSVGRRSREEEHESRSGSDNMDGASGDDQDAADNPPRKKRYHRHTPQQIQELEAYDFMIQNKVLSLLFQLVYVFPMEHHLHKFFFLCLVLV